MTDQEKLLREMLWLRHGCPVSALYGDDGEMQCSACGIDFKRNAAERIQARFEESKAFIARIKAYVEIGGEPR